VGGGPGAGLEGVRGEGAAEGQLHVCVDVDAAGHHVPIGRVDDVDIPTAAQALGDLAAGSDDRLDHLPRHHHIGPDASRGADDGPVGDERAHGVLLFSVRRGVAPCAIRSRRLPALPLL